MADGCQGFAPADDSVADRERERWSAQGWTGSASHASGRWAAAFGEGGAFDFSPPRSGKRSRQLTVQESPAKSGIELANWNLVRQFILESLGISLSRKLPELSAPGWVALSPKKRLVKADKQKRESFVAEYAVRWDEAGRSGARILTRPNSGRTPLRDKWVCLGGLAMARRPLLLVPGDGRGGMDGTATVAFLEQLRQKRSGPFVIWDNAPATAGRP